MKNCETCAHLLQPQGGWCYMFREEPIAVSCAKHTLAEPAGWSLPSLPSFLSRDSLVNVLTPSPDTAVKLVNLGLEMYQGAQAKLADTAASAADLAQSTASSITDAASSVVDTASEGLSAAGDAASAGLDAVVAVGSGAAELAGSIVEGVGEIAGALTDL